MRLNRYVSSLSALLILLASTAAAWAQSERELVLVRQGQSVAPIIMPADAPPMTRDAAAMLAHCIEQTSGAKPRIIEGTPSPLPEKAIWVGYQPVLEKLFANLSFKFEKPEEILIAANENHLVIVGRDVWMPQALKRVIRHGHIFNGKQQEYGTANAVYTFLQDHLGVRWLWPGELGQDVLKKPTISFKPFIHRYAPQFRYRNEAFYFSGLNRGDTAPGHSGQWTKVQRLRLDSLYLRADGHAFNDWWDRFHETHPEYFALQPNGKRDGFPKPQYAKLCVSNPAVWQQWLEDVAAQLEKYPDRTIFNAAANDGWTSGHCVCEHCRAWDDLSAQRYRFVWQGVSQEYVSLSDREINFANKCAQLLKQRYPDKPYFVLVHAYGLARAAPISVKPADNVIVSLVMNSFGRPKARDSASPTDGQLLRDQMRDWAKVTKHLVWRPNVDDLVGRWRALPDVGLSQAMDDFAFIRDLGMEGFFSALPEHWATQGPLYYLVAQLTWNPFQDGHAVLRDYYQRGFGPAASDIEAYWQLMERTRDRFIGSRMAGEDGVAYDAFDEPVLREAQAILRRAAAAAKGHEKYAQRVAFVQAGLQYVKLVCDSHRQMARAKEAQGNQREAALQQARENWAAMRQIMRETPHGFAWHWIHRRIRNLNPDEGSQ